MAASLFRADLLAYNFNLEITSFISRLKQSTARSQHKSLTGQSFMHELAREGDVLTAETIAAFGSDIDLPDEEGRRPLHEAAAHGHADMVRFLLNAGALLDAPIHPFGHTPLYYAVLYGHIPVVKLLIQRGARLGVQDRLSGQGLLHMAASSGDATLCGILIAAGIDVFIEDNRGQTARDLAARNNHRDLEAVLLKVMAHHAHYGVH